MPDILRDLLANGADEAPAISAPGRPALTFGALRSLIGDTLSQLNALCIGRNDRVAIVLANGPEMATCFMVMPVRSASSARSSRVGYLHQQANGHMGWCMGSQHRSKQAT